MDLVPLSKLGRLVACDTETTGTNPWKGDRPFAVSMCDEDGRAWFRSWPVDPMTREVKIPRRDRRTLRFFFRSRRRIVFHNGKFDLRMLRMAGCIDGWPRGGWDDTLVAARVARSDELSYQLKFLAARHLDYPRDDEKELKAEVRRLRRVGKKEGWAITPAGEDGAVERDYWLAPDHVEPYALKDAERTIILWLFYREVMEEDGLLDVYSREMAVQEPVTRMEDRGVLIDTRELIQFAYRMGVQAHAARREIDEIFGAEFNPNSYPQKREHFYGKFGLPVTSTTKNRNPSVDGDALEGWAAQGVAGAGELLEWSRAEKLLQFCRRWRELLVDRVLHPTLEPTATKTGRFSCRDPNLQQVPKRSKEAKLARRPFVPRPGHVWVLLDYSQMELRLLAGLANEGAMLDAFAAGEDIHATTARLVFGRDDEYHRLLAKNLNFAIVFGAGPKKAALMMGGVPIDDAKDFLDRYYQRFPRVQAFMDECSNAVRREGYIVNPYGRRVYVNPDYAYRGVNSLIQSTGADVLKVAMPRIEDFLEDRRAWIVLPVHDELVVEARTQAYCLGLVRGVRDLMEDHGGVLPIELPVDAALARACWAKSKEIAA